MGDLLAGRVVTVVLAVAVPPLAPALAAVGVSSSLTMPSATSVGGTSPARSR